LVLVDLSTQGLDLRALIRRLRAVSSRAISIVAYGPHVQEANLAAAREAGCDEVLARGQIDLQIEAMLARSKE